MSPEELNRLFIIHNNKYNQQQILDEAVKYTLDKAVEIIKKQQGHDEIYIKTYTKNKIMTIHPWEILKELNKLGYKTSERTVGYEQDSEDYWILHFN